MIRLPAIRTCVWVALGALAAPRPALAQASGCADPPSAAELRERLGAPPPPAELLEQLAQRIADARPAPAEPACTVELLDAMSAAIDRGDLAELASISDELAREWSAVFGDDDVGVRNLRRAARVYARMDALPSERRDAAIEALRGSVAREEGRPSEADALAAWERAGLCDSEPFARAAAEAGMERLLRAAFQDAELVARRGLAAQLASELRDRNAALLLRIWGQALTRLGRPEEAVAPLALACAVELDTARQPGERLVAAFADLGSAALESGRNALARACGEAALDLGRRLGLPPEATASSANLLALALRRSNRLAEAELILRRSERDLRAAGRSSSSDLQATLLNLGLVLRIRGDLDGAEAVLTEALELGESWGRDHPSVAWSAFHLARLQVARGAVDEAAPLFERARGVFARSGMDADALRARAYAAHAAGGDERLERLRSLRAEELPPDLAALVRSLIAGALFERGDVEAAADEARASLGEFLRLEHPPSDAIPTAHANLGLCLLAAHRPEEAVPELETAFDGLEQAFRGGPRAELEGAWFAESLGHGAVAAWLVRALLECGRTERALTAAEAARERPMLELLAQAEALDPRGDGIERPGATPLDAAALRASLSEGEVLLAFVWSERVAAVLCARPEGAGDVTSALLATDVSQVAEIERAVERLASALAEGSSSGAVDEAAERVRAALLPERVRAVLAGARRVLWVPSGPLNALPLDLLLAGDDGAIPVVVAAPSATVLARARAAARAHARSEPAPSAVLLGDPAYPDADAEAIASADWRSAARAASFGAPLARPSPGSPLPRLPGSRDEVRAIAQVFEKAGGRARVLLERDATPGALERALDDRESAPRYVHIAAHGRSGTSASPHDAALALAPDTASARAPGFLTLDELLTRWPGRLSASELCVLSACDSQRGVAVGDSWMALSWGFLAAGSPSVVASLWKVDDRATSLLMVRFYESLLGSFDAPRAIGGRTYAPGRALPKAEALAEAKAWLRGASLAELGPGARTERSTTPSAGPTEVDPAGLHPYASPRYWSAFVLIGSPD